MKKIKQYAALGILAGALFAAAPTESRASGYMIAGSAIETQTQSPAMGSGNVTDSRAPQLGSGARTESTGLFGSGSFTEAVSGFFSAIFQ